MYFLIGKNDQISNKYKDDFYVILEPDNWNDYGYRTLFDAYLYRKNIKYESLGQVKIAFLGEIKDDNFTARDVKTYLLKTFVALDSNYCSLWQETESYKKIREIEFRYSIKILQPLNDIILMIDKIDELMKNNFVDISLMRFVSSFSCRNEFYNAYYGCLSEQFNFVHHYDDNQDYSAKEIVFNVVRNAYPPMNVHALIGPNASGKTYTITKIAENFIGMKTDNKSIESIFLVSFNPFDDYHEFLNEITKEKHKKSFVFIGTKSLDLHSKNKNNDELMNDFFESIQGCAAIPKKIQEWNDFLDEMIKCFNVQNLEELYLDNDKDFDFLIGDDITISKYKNAFNHLSAGYKEVVSIVAGTIARMAEKSLLLMDEPENHLHPPLLSMLIRWLSMILARRNAFAIIATHSPIILQEIPKSCVWIMERFGDIRKIRRPSLETFGANLSTLTYEVFKYQILDTGFNRLLKEIADKSNNYEDALEKFNGQLGEDAKSMLRILCYEKEHNK